MCSARCPAYGYACLQSSLQRETFYGIRFLKKELKLKNFILNQKIVFWSISWDQCVYGKSIVFAKNENIFHT